jgi:hypothetical protein
VLNEEDFVPEHFTGYGERLVIGDRTGFAFYLDSENDRKLLIGVYAINVMWNNWYDGPFDQLLDNYTRVGKVEIRKYMEAHDPGTAGKIDQYGNHHLEGPGMRVAIAPYMTYFDIEPLASLIASCRERAETQSELYTCLTQENHDGVLAPPYPPDFHAGSRAAVEESTFIHFPEGSDRSNYAHAHEGEPTTHERTSSKHIDDGENKTRFFHAGSEGPVERAE